ncbi:MAG: hypothetical protein IPN15_22735 [Saprospiraceae bacterium]|nr:hypothetical protein [Candidatus Vicinibacter affinis]
MSTLNSSANASCSCTEESASACAAANCCSNFKNPPVFYWGCIVSADSFAAHKFPLVHAQ